MRALRRTIALALLAALPAAAQRENGAPQDWGDRAWTARVAFEVERISGPSVGMELPTAALARPDGADLRVFVAGGKELPLSVIHSGPGDRVLLAFDAAPFQKGARGHVYLGNPGQRRPARPWSGRHGIILEVRKLDAALIESQAQMELALKRSSEVLGRAFVDRIFQGINPFSEERRCLALYSGFLNARDDGEYHLAVNSYDAALLVVDDRVVVSWLGWHDPEHRSSREQSAKLKLGKGAHPFRFYNATRNRGVACSLGIRPPGAKSMVLAPPSAFVAWTRPRLLSLEHRDEGRKAYFTWKGTGDLGLSGRAVTAIEFEDLSGVPAASRRGDFWDFGDGTTSRESSPQHVFLESGVFAVEHTVFTREGRRLSLTQKVFVHPEGCSGGRVWSDVKAYAKVLQSYNPERLSPAALANAVFVLRAAELFDQALPFLGAMIEGAKDLDGPHLSEEVFFFVEELRDRQRDYQRALKILSTIVEKSLSPDRRLRAMALQAEIYYDHLDDIPRARACVDEILRLAGKSASEPLRHALLKRADLLLEEGKREEARAVLERAAKMQRGERFMGALEVSAGEHMVAYEEFSGRKDYTAALRELRQWELDAPLDKLNGLLRYLRADLCVCLGRPREALVELARLDKADPDSPELPAALIMAAQCHLALGEKDVARACLQRVIDEFPVSSARGEAEKRLESIDR